MNQNIKKTLAAFTLAFAFVGANAFADDTATSHEQHHPATATTDAATNSAKDKGMMGGMKMDDMMGMMHECMSSHKDGKMCEKECMTKCQEKMGKGECKKMMKEAKAKEAKEKK